MSVLYKQQARSIHPSSPFPATYLYAIFGMEVSNSTAFTSTRDCRVAGVIFGWINFLPDHCPCLSSLITVLVSSL